MMFKKLALGASVAATVLMAGFAAKAQDAINFVHNTYRTGAFSGSGIPVGDGVRDYFAMLNARLNLLRPLFADADYPVIRFAFALNSTTYDWAISHEIAVPLYDYIRRDAHWHLVADDALADPINDLRRSCMLQGPVGASAGPWYAIASKGQVAKDSDGEKIELGRYRYVFASAEIAYNLWNDAINQSTDLPKCLRQYVLAHELVFRCCGGLEIVMSNFVSANVTDPLSN